MIEGNMYPKNEENKELMESFLDSLCECHKFMKNNCDISTVSLREIRRFNIFFIFLKII